MKRAFLVFSGLLLSLTLIFNLGYAQDDVDGDMGGEDLEAVEGKEGFVTFDFKNADIRNVLRIFSHKTGINIVAGKDVSGNVTITLRDVPWEKALKLVLSINGYGYVRDGNVIKVLTLEQLSLEPLETRVYILNYAKPGDVKGTVEKILSERGMINIDERAGLLIITEVPSKFKDLDLVIERIDTATPQVLIESQFVETTLINGNDVGIKWNFLKEYKFTAGPLVDGYIDTRTVTDASEWGTAKAGANTYSYYPNREDLHNRQYGGTQTVYDQEWVVGQVLTDDTNTTLGNITTNTRTATLTAAAAELVLSALLSDSGTDILSSPHVVTTDNQTAEIMVGEQYPLANYVFNSDTGRLEVQGFEYKDIGIKLKVTPKISPDGYVTMVLEPEISTKGDNITFGGAAGTTVPTIDTENIKTTVLVKDGDTLLLGGLIKQSDSYTYSQVPFLGDIPLLGHFFKHKSKTIDKRNLIIFITPTVIKMENARDVTKRKSDEYLEKRKAIKYNTDLLPSINE